MYWMIDASSRWELFPFRGSWRMISSFNHVYTTTITAMGKNVSDNRFETHSNNIVLITWGQSFCSFPIESVWLRAKSLERNEQFISTQIGFKMRERLCLNFYPESMTEILFGAGMAWLIRFFASLSPPRSLHFDLFQHLLYDFSRKQNRWTMLRSMNIIQCFLGILLISGDFFFSLFILKIFKCELLTIFVHSHLKAFFKSARLALITMCFIDYTSAGSSLTPE